MCVFFFLFFFFLLFFFGGCLFQMSDSLLAEVYVTCLLNLFHSKIISSKIIFRQRFHPSGLLLSLPRLHHTICITYYTQNTDIVMYKCYHYDIKACNADDSLPSIECATMPLLFLTQSTNYVVLQ